jgi:CHAT domain-containing protein/Tfp pilus assembly protein PilF
MTPDMKFSKARCLGDEDLYLYLSGQGNSEMLGSMEFHFAQCAECRRHLAELVEILHPGDEQTEQEIPVLSQEERDQALGIIQGISIKERSTSLRPSYRFRWPLAAAASIAIVALTFWGLKFFYEIRKSEAFFTQAEAILNQNYVDASPSNLRLDFPFHSASTSRSVVAPESLRQAENLFFQALAFQESMTKAHLGLACIYLRESKLVPARDEFQKVLAIDKGNVPAWIGHGVTQYEEAIQSGDPLKRRIELEGALSDFNEALKMVPGSSEALYNKIWTLFESGLHKEALQEIERYLVRDSNSVWAEALKGLKVRMRATQLSAVQEDVLRFARERNKDALMELVRQAPYQMPAAIKFVMRRSNKLDWTPVESGRSDPENLCWAFDVMETAYRASTGDAGFKALPAFYAGLSPPQRELKKILDNKFKDLDDLFLKGQFADVLKASAPLISQYTKLQDFWNMADIHHLRGNALYLGKADFHAAEAEYRKMLGLADRMNALALKANALGLVALAFSAQSKFDDGLQYAAEIQSLAQEHHLKSSELYSHMRLGALFRGMGQFDQSFREYTAALKMGYQLLDGLYVVESLENLAHLADRLGRIQDARSLYQWTLQQQDEFLTNRILQSRPELTNRRLNMLFAQGALALRCGEWVSAESWFQKSLNSTPSDMHELAGRNRLGLAEIYLRTDRIPEAEAMVDSVMAPGASGRYPEIEWQAHSLKGQLLERSGNHAEALASLQQAMKALETMRRSIQSENMRQSFFMDRFDPFKTMVSILHISSNNKKALEYVDRAKSMTLRESLGMPEWMSSSRENSIQGEQKISAYPIVEYFFIDSGLLISFTRGEQVECVSTKISEAEFSSQVKECLECVKKNDTKRFSRIARKLYDELIAPVEKSLFADSFETLILLPDGPLHLLPFAGLQDPQGRFLIEKTPIAVAPSRIVLRHCLAKGQKMPSANLHATLIDGSAGLSSAQKELAYISRLYGRNAAILASRDLSVFKPSVAHSEIVHFSGHSAEMQGKPVLLLRAAPNEIFLNCQTIAAWRLPQSCLVNLAGCSTGIGPLSEGESPWGLIPAFLNAGAPAIIASLAPVDDASTERLNCRLYELLREGVGKAKALQKAQIALLDSARSQSDIRPQSWIPYILIGNPQ